MKDIRLLHKEAIDLVKNANIFLDNNDRKNYLSIIEKAFYLEKEASMELAMNFSAEPTRSVLFRSAANLAYLCGKFDEAKKLIHFALTGEPFHELYEELLELQIKIEQCISLRPNEQEITENAYFEYLKQKSINIKIEPKSTKFSRAVAISYISDFLRNIQQAYLNFSEINFLKNFSITDFNDFNNAQKSFLNETELLAVDFKFRSFGVSLVADTGTMNYNWSNSDKFVDFRSQLFTNFKHDVLTPDYNNRDFRNTISKKYNDVERKKIYSSILPSLTDKSPYLVSIANEDFSKKIETFKPLTKDSKLVFSPPIIKEEEIEVSLIRKTEQKKGPRSKTIMIEQLKNAEFQVDINNIHSENKNYYFTEPHNLLILFSENHYTIKDEFFELFTQSDDYNLIINDFHKLFINKYISLLSDKNNLDQTHLELLIRFEKSGMRDW